jgi:hypothetical protein
LVYWYAISRDSRAAVLKSAPTFMVAALITPTGAWGPAARWMYCRPVRAGAVGRCQVRPRAWGSVPRTASAAPMSGVYVSEWGWSASKSQVARLPAAILSSAKVLNTLLAASGP